jgi:N-acetylglucosamine malate deacetylase 1
MTEKTRILAIHAHPDDIEILAGGTMARLAENGCSLVLATMTAGDCGSREYDPEELSTIRRREAAASANLIGAEYFCAGFKDLVIFNDDASRRRVTELLRLARPQVVITASPEDYHCDHEATSVLVRDACFAAGVPNYKTGDAEALDWIPHLYFMDPVEGVDRDGVPVRPDFGVDVEKQMGTKREMLACHQSQREWLKKHHGIDDYIEMMSKWTASIGERFRLQYAEGFRHYRVHPFPTSELLPKLVGEVIIPT